MNEKNFKCLEGTFNDLGIDILSNGLFKGDRSWNFKDVTSPFNRLYFVLSGAAYIENENEKVMLLPGNVYLIPAGTRYSYICEKMICKLYFHFNLELVPGSDIFKMLGHCMKMQYPLESANRLIRLLDDSGLSALMKFKAELISVLAEFLQLAEDREHMTFSYERLSRYALLLSYIKNNLSAELRISEVENKFNYSSYVLSRKFKKDTGTSLKGYIEGMLLDKGKQLLLSTDMDIKQIAHSLQFGDQYYFSRFFKKQTGLSPRKYREKHSMQHMKQTTADN